MRILHLCKSLNTQLGGIQTHTRALTAALAQQGMGVSILTGVGWRGEENLPDIEGVEVIPLRHVPGHRVRGFRRSGDDLAFNLAALRWLRREQRQYDLVHVQGRSGLLHAACGQHRRPVVMTFHGLTREEYRYARGPRSASQDQWAHQALIHPLEHRAYRRAARVITVSHFMAGQLEAHFGAQPQGLRVISNGVYMDQWGWGRPQAQTGQTGRRWITFLGRIEENKGVRFLPEVLAQLPESLSLRIIGTGRLEHWLQGELARRGLWERVQWVGPLPNEEVPVWLAHSLALVVPSLYEPQGLVVLEAFTQGVPVIASDVGGLREMVRNGENGWLVPPREPQAMVQRLIELVERPQQADLLGQAGQQMVQQQYLWTDIAAQTRALYESMLCHQPKSLSPV